MLYFAFIVFFGTYLLIASEKIHKTAAALMGAVLMMLLVLPCVAADVGGVTTMMTHEKEGFVYQSTASYMLAHYICKIFAMEDAASLGQAAKAHASLTHDPQKNLQDLLAIYQSLK